jgi:hypothetical protein
MNHLKYFAKYNPIFINKHDSTWSVPNMEKSQSIGQWQADTKRLGWLLQSR